MNCLKCGRETSSEQCFCQDCLLDMEKYPVKPGTVIQLPKRREGSASRKNTKRRSVSLEDQVKSTAVMTYSSVALGIAGIFGNAIGTLILSLTGNVRLVFVFAGTAAAAGLMIGLFGLARKIWK